MQQKTNYQATCLFMGLVLIIYALAWHLQQRLLLNADVSWLMEASRRLLAGGSYSKDFFELNPPMILYIYMPAVWLTGLFQWPPEFALRFYVFSLSFLSLGVCAYLTRYIFNPADQALRAIFILMLLSLFCIFPIYEFGQRELLLLIFSFPYFILMAARLYAYQPSRLLSVSVGILAGIGFAIKPYFLATFVLMELYYSYKEKSLLSCLRTEVFAICAVIAVYISLILLLHQDYLLFIVPFINQFYYHDYQSPFRVIFFNDQAMYFYFSLTLFALFYKKLAYKQLAIVLIVASVGFYISYLSQSTYWYYHILPMFAGAVALFGLIYFSFVLDTAFTLLDYVKLGLWGVLFGAYLYVCLSYISLGINFYPSIYFGLFFIIFAPLLYAAYQGKHIVSITIALVTIFAVSYIFYKNVQLSIWLKHIFLLSNALLLLSFILILPRDIGTKTRYGFFAIFGLVVFSYPFYWSAYLYHSSLEFKRIYLQLVQEMRSFPHQSVYFFTDSDQFPYPALDYTHQPLASRFASLGGMPIFKNIDDPHEYEIAYKANRSRLNVFVAAIVEDFKEKHPDLIFVDVRKPNGKLHYFGNTQLDYIQLFSQNPMFKAAWTDYEYVKTIDGQPLYKFNIYRRKT